MINYLQVSAFQKLCLCSLVLYGSVRPLPSFVGSIVYKEVQKASAPYSVLCRPDCSLSFLQAFVQEHAELLKKVTHTQYIHTITSAENHSLQCLYTFFTTWLRI